MKTDRFEKLEVWQTTRELTREIYRITRDGEFARDFGLRDQLRRSAVSVLSNIAEGFERNNDREFRRFLMIAKGSFGEARAQLIVAHDVGYVTDQDYKELGSKMVQVSSQIATLARYLDQSINERETKN